MHWFRALQYAAVVALGACASASVASLAYEFAAPRAFTNYVAFWGFMTGLFGIPTLLLLRSIWR